MERGAGTADRQPGSIPGVAGRGERLCGVSVGCRGTGGDVEYRSATNARVYSAGDAGKIDGDVLRRRGNTSRKANGAAGAGGRARKCTYRRMANAERRRAVLGRGNHHGAV